MYGTQICKRCVMDTTAEEIVFDSEGVCSFCYYFDDKVKPLLDRTLTPSGEAIFQNLLQEIKQAGKDRRYDSVLGISGGIDSSYLAYLVSTSGLRPLAVHVDTGWNTQESEDNVKKLVKKLGLDLEIIRVNWDEMVDLQVAFYRASLKNCEIPQDHAFLAALYKKANDIGARHILTGGNLATESILPASWGYNAGDLRHMLAVHKRFGNATLKDFPKLSFWRRYFYYPYIKHIWEVRLLNYTPYNRKEAKEKLTNEIGWRDYGLKHHESVLTRFFQAYYLPTKFGIDKRKAHFSSMILSGQMSREEAIKELRKKPYPSDKQLEIDKAIIAEKLGLSLAEWEDILNLPPRNHDEFPSSRLLFKTKDMMVNLLGIRKRRYGL